MQIRCLNVPLHASVLRLTHGRKSFNFRSHSIVIENYQATGAYLIQITQLTLLNTTLDPSMISIWLYENITADQYGQNDLNVLSHRSLLYS